METKQLTDAQFTAAQDALDAMFRGARKDPAQKAVVAAIVGEWESAYALPVRTFDQRAIRLAAIAAVAVKHNLVSL